LLKISDPLIVSVVAAAGALSAVVDLQTRRVPNALTFGVSALGFALAATHVSGLSLGAAAAGFGLGLALMLPGHIIGATGAGDVKLFAALGSLLGPSRIVTAFVYTALAGGVLAILIARRRRLLRATIERTAALVQTAAANVAEIESPTTNNRFAYAPAIALGALAAVLGM
jgi:prepilin peptidase CpaA